VISLERLVLDSRAKKFLSRTVRARRGAKGAWWRVRSRAVRAGSQTNRRVGERNRQPSSQSQSSPVPPRMTIGFNARPAVKFRRVGTARLGETLDVWRWPPKRKNPARPRRRGDRARRRLLHCTGQQLARRVSRGPSDISGRNRRDFCRFSRVGSTRSVDPNRTFVWRNGVVAR
jgi:hypothetical protein